MPSNIEQPQIVPERSLLVQGVLRHRDVYGDLLKKNQKKQAAGVQGQQAASEGQSDPDESQTTDSNQERARFKMLMQQKQILTHQITKRTAMKSYLQNNDKKAKQ